MKTFKNKLKFHSPGLAPVEDETGWYHIDTKENPIYSQHYSRAFGYYDGLAAVTDFDGNCYHIDTQVKRVYLENYAFCGNYQEKKCVVRDLMAIIIISISMENVCIQIITVMLEISRTVMPA